MVVEELGELLDVLGKRQRGRVTEEEIADEAADVIMVAVHACAVEGIPLPMLWRQLMTKLGRTKNRVAEELWGQAYDSLDEDGQAYVDEMLEHQDLDEEGST